MMHVFLSRDSPSQKTIVNIFYSFRRVVGGGFNGVETVCELKHFVLKTFVLKIT